MTAIKINEQIAFLRKQRGMTQEELACALGVTNQSVSKWESAQCCPDIQLLPDIAKLFEVSVDELLGYTPAATAEDIILALRRKTEALHKGEDLDFSFRIASAMHTIVFSKEMTAHNVDPGWDTDAAIEQAGTAEWGYSCYNTPEITTMQRHGAVFFAKNRDLTMENADIRRTALMIKPFCDATNLKIAVALYRLTVHSEDAYATVSQIGDKSGVTPERVQSCLDGELSPFIAAKEGAEGEFRFEGMYMHIIPILSLFDFK